MTTAWCHCPYASRTSTSSPTELPNGAPLTAGAATASAPSFVAGASVGVAA
eukprot:CAMPEP_0119392826 /NCGR_PEP_ID=MMETSP1334-20130426/122842_1 /TAXON_ID=127549 /ORGANISM="Calcidiscus leptoporus, Strain RCC1130" /LENGTH=50 /DNA_ID=CAMNT_0007415739 /DNA_START=71 /DNA_END=219 /DNA_ORIENTATION=-